MSLAPLVSVIIPAYNAGIFIERTLISVLSQTYQKLEVLVVDDGSQDSTEEIIQQIAMVDRRVIFLQQPNAGVAAARNLGVQHSKGEFIAPIDADDVWHPQNIEKQLQCILRCGEEVGLVYAWSEDINESDLLTGGFCASPIEGSVYKTLVCHNFLGNASSSLIRRSCFEQLGGYNCRLREENAQGCEDWELFLRIAEDYQFKVVSEFLIGYRKVSSSMSSDYTQMARSHALVMRGVQQRHPEMSTIFFRLSSCGLYMYFANQSNRSQRHPTTLFWLREAIRAGQIISWFRADLYILLVQSLFGLWRSPYQRRLAILLRLVKCHLFHLLVSRRSRLLFSRTVIHPAKWFRSSGVSPINSLPRIREGKQ